MDEERAVGRNRLDDAGQTRGDARVEGQHPGVEPGIDLLSELDDERRVPAGKKLRRAGSLHRKPLARSAEASGVAGQASRGAQPAEGRSSASRIRGTWYC